MKGDPKVIEALNKGLTAELTAINQYMVHAKMCENWGYHKLAKARFQDALGEMKHAEQFIERILFLEGTPEISRYDVIRIGTEPKQQLENDLALEKGGVKLYNESIALCAQVQDASSRELFEHIVKEEEGHVNWLESQLLLIQTVGIENYLTEQIGEPQGH